MEIKLKYIMSKKVVTLSPDSMVMDLAHTFVETQVSCVIITDGAVPIGIVTEKDMAKVVLHEINPRTTHVKEIMTSPVISLTEEDTIEDAIELFTTKKIRHVVITKNKEFCGVVTQTDIVREENLGR